MQFLTLDRDSFAYGSSQPVARLVRRVIAENPSKFTYHGTGTYIVGGDEHGRGDVVVIDPGPTLDSHRDPLAASLEGCTVRAILVTHCHADHSPLAAWLSAESGAPTVAFGPHGDDAWDIGEDPDVDEPESASASADDPGIEPAEPVVEESTDRDFVPDVVAATGDVVAAADGWVITGLHTPGHTSNHLCFALDDGATRTLFHCRIGARLPFLYFLASKLIRLQFWSQQHADEETPLFAHYASRWATRNDPDQPERFWL